MARFIDIGQEAHGIIAIGQVATGVVAIGQLATGVIAIGQLARGFFAVGMMAVGLVTVAMGGAGVLHVTAIAGVGASGFGMVLPLVPPWPSRFRRPEARPFGELTAREGETAWVEVELSVTGGEPVLMAGGSPLPVRFSRACYAACRSLSPDPGDTLYARLRHRNGEWLCERFRVVPPRAHRQRLFWTWLVGGGVVLGVLALVWWWVAALPALSVLFRV